MAKSLGTPLTPMQQHIADVATERREDGSYEYQVVVVSVPRQTGKTTLLRALGTHRALVLGRQVFYTAQTGKDARERWLDLVKTIRVHPALKSRAKVSLRGGSESVEFPGGGEFRVFAPTSESLHGYTPPCVMIDEAFSLVGDYGDLLMGAIGPAQITIHDKQLWIVSTAGTDESVFLHDWIDRGMEGAPRVACFVWGATDDQDPFDLEDIAAFHPGVGNTFNGHELTAADVLAEADRNSRAEYERAFANRRTVTMSYLIPPDQWRPLAEPGLVPPSRTSDVVLAYDVAHDRRSASIVAAWVTEGGRVAVKPVAARSGYTWLTDKVTELRSTWRPMDVVAADNGPVLEVNAALPGLVTPVREREFAISASTFLNLINDQLLVHDGDPALELSAAGLVTRTAAVDGVAFSRRHSVGDSSLGIAASLAARRAHEGGPRSAIYVG